MRKEALPIMYRFGGSVVFPPLIGIQGIQAKLCMHVYIDGCLRSLTLSYSDLSA